MTEAYENWPKAQETLDFIVVDTNGDILRTCSDIESIGEDLSSTNQATFSKLPGAIEVFSLHDHTFKGKKSKSVETQLIITVADGFAIQFLPHESIDVFCINSPIIDKAYCEHLVFDYVNVKEDPVEIHSGQKLGDILVVTQEEMERFKAFETNYFCEGAEKLLAGQSNPLDVIADILADEEKKQQKRGCDLKSLSLDLV